MKSPFVPILSLSLALLCPWPTSLARAASRVFPCETVLEYGTGMSSGGNKLRDGSVDPFFDGVTANFPDRGSVYVPTNVPTAWLADSASADSQWVAPLLNPSAAAAGTYIYRLRFVTPCAGGRATGRFAASDRAGIFLNGSDTRIATPTTGWTDWTPFSLSNLPMGTNTLDFYVTNAPTAVGPPGPSGLRAEVTVVATCCPCIVLDCPPNLMVTNCSATAPVFYTVTGTNRCDTNLFINCTPPSGSAFPAGSTTVSCLATDNASHRTNCSFTVTVIRDSREPQIQCPKDIVLLCGVAGGTNVFFNVGATDDFDPNPTMTCVPPSGSFFPLGTTPVTCTARDQCGRTSKCSFAVVVSGEPFTQVLQAGVADNFTGEREPTTIGPCLQTSGVWGSKWLDDPFPSRPLAHTFQFLGNSILSAKVTLVMKPTRPASLDDTLRLGLTGCAPPGTWAFDEPISSLPGAGGTWTTNLPTTFVFDLAALPGGVSLLAHLNAEQRLDFVVSADTAVDYARLELKVCGPNGAFSGVPYSVLGARAIPTGNGLHFEPLQAGAPFEIGWDIGLADGIEWEFDPQPSGCFQINNHEGLTTDWPAGEGRIATLSILQGSPATQTRLNMSQPTNTTGKAIEVWNNGALVSRYFLPGSGDTAVNVPETACLFTMGFGNGYFFANFEDPVPVTLLTGNHVSGQVGPVVNGDTVKLHFNLYASVPAPKRPVIKFDKAFDLSRLRIEHLGDLIEGNENQTLTIADIAVSRKFVDVIGGLLSDCIWASPGWTLELNGVADFCDFSVVPPACNAQPLEVNLYGYENVKTWVGGLRLTPTALPADNCQITATIGSAPVVNVQVTPSGGGAPITVNNVSNVLASHWPTSVGGNAGPQSFRVDFPLNTVVTVGAQNYNASRVTFLANPTVLFQFYQVCLESSHLQLMSFKSFTAPPTNAPAPCVALRCPASVNVTCADLSGGVATFVVDATSRCGSNVVVTCVPPSGSVFPPGTTYVHCIGTDSFGYRDECRFPVVVGDTVPPRLVIPPRMIVPCSSPRGAVVEYVAASVDNCDPTVTIECEPPSGSVFPAGTNYVTCAAVDASGNRSSVEFPVVVNGGCSTTRCLDLTVPDDITVRCSGSGGASVTFIATGRDTCTGGQITPICDPPAGSVFPVGLTRVVCTVRSGTNEATAGFIVEVTDDTPPQLACSRNIQVPAQSMSGAVVAFTATGTDDCSPPVRIRCSPLSGSEFPVGTTQVMCEGTDGSGNRTTCVFSVTVDAPPPFQASLQPSNRIELRWIGDAIVEAAGALGDEAQWADLGGAVQGDGSVRVMSFSPTGGQQFFRLRPLPLLPPTDTDGDGVPDSVDRCPGTPPGSVVDAQGCSALDFLGAPDGVFEPERAQGQRTLRLLQQDGSFQELLTRLTPQLDPSNNPALFLNQRLLTDALGSQSNLVTGLRSALAEFQRMKPLRSAAILRGAKTLDPAHADVRPEDFELMQLDDIEQSLMDVLGGSEASLVRLANLAQAAGASRNRERVRIRSFDPARGVATLADGRQVLLPALSGPGAPPIEQIRGVLGQESDVDLEVSRLPDGSLFGHAATPALSVNSNLIWKLDPRCLRLRIVPASPGLPDFDFGERHFLNAYKWGFTASASYHFLEFGMGLAVTKINCVTEPAGAFRHWLKIEYDANLDGTFGMLIGRIEETSPTYVLKPTILPSNKPFPLLVREFRAPIQSDGTEGQAELLGEDTFTVEINAWGHYADAFYTRTIFELADKPANQTSQFQTATVNDLAVSFPLTLKPLNQQTFSALSYTPSGNSSSYPNVNQIHLNQSFAVHVDDPNSQLFFAYSNDVGRALYAPTLSGFNHGKPYRYRVTLPKVVRDRVHNCTGTDSYYRIPFIGPLGFNLYGPWRVSQGNNGDFTHNGWQTYAWDFPKSQGTPIFAARGGIVVDTRASGSQSCWDDDIEECVGCSGSKAGNFVKIRHQDGTAGVYFHFKYNGVSVSKGQKVYRGDVLGYVGTTGCSTGPHLHFHVITDPDTNQTIPARFECYDDDFDFRECYLPPSGSDGFSTNKPWWWPF